MSDDAPEFPTASVVHRASTMAKRSRWWWLTLACFVLAIGLAWVSHRPSGIPIVIHFDQGHGLKVGDTIRHRGIEVGVIEAVELAPDLSGIEARASLSRKARSVAVADSKFWIVRPRIAMDGVSGLDTAIGAKYIRVVPGKSTHSKWEFQGLAMEPTNSDGVAGSTPTHGLELLLRSSRRKGIYASAPVSYRGVQVGRVLSVGLSPDAKFVDIRVRIDESYRRLVRKSSVFWVTSGLDVDIGVTGVSINAESLASIAKGGITFVTLSASSDDSDLVAPGHGFSLNEAPEDEWLQASSAVNLMVVDPVPVLGIQSAWQTSFLGMTKMREDHAVVMLVRGDQGMILLAPADIFAQHADPDAKGFAANIVSAKDSRGVPLAPDQFETVSHAPARSIATIPMGERLVGSPSIAIDRIRPLNPNQPEDCFVSYSGTSQTSMLMVAKQSILPGNGCWNLHDARFNRQPWHGSPVIAVSDKRLIGMMMVQNGQVTIVPIPSKLWSP